ncbi:MAG TPA: hypothetical protein PK478_13490, partial [Nitrospira sp.]|nr:hypothetical protein [Nitrospira sp.]
WWVNPAVGTATLEELRHADDFRWLVRDGKRVVHADDCPPQVAYEAYAFQASNLWELLAQAEKERDTAEQQLATAHAEHEKSLTDWARAREERDQALRGLADLQRLVAAAEANELVLVHPDWRQAEIDELTEERDQLSQELAQVKWFREQTQRRRDHLSNAHQELRRQFDVAVNDRNILRARCDELERGDRHSCGVKCGQQEERRAVVAWLNKNPQGWARQWSLAGRIERGEHDV